jgi:hypothetical protein
LHDDHGIHRRRVSVFTFDISNRIMDKLNFNSEKSVARIERIQELLRSQAMSQQELADAIFVSNRYARDYIVYLQEIGCIHIADFRRGTLPGNRRHHIALYRWGMGADAVAPPMERKPRTIATDPDERRDRAVALKKAAAIQPFRDWSAAWIPTRTQHD